MWSNSGVEEHTTTITNSSSSKGLSRGSSSSPSTSSSPSPFSPLHNSSSRAKTMEEVWKDINLASLHDDNPSRDHDPHSTNFRGMILQDFLARPFSKDPPTSAAAVSARYGSPVPPPATMLTLNSCHELHFFGNLDPLRQNPLLQHQPMPQVCSHNVPFDAFAPASGMNPSGKKRFPESDNDSGGRRHKRMIKNRESAARSRARKQAYTNELELEVAHLMEENARLKKQQQQLCLAAEAEIPKKYKLHRTSTAPF